MELSCCLLQLNRHSEGQLEVEPSKKPTLGAARYQLTSALLGRGPTCDLAHQLHGYVNAVQLAGAMVEQPSRQNSSATRFLPAQSVSYAPSLRRLRKRIGVELREDAFFSSEILEVVQMVVGVPIPGRSPSVSPCFALKILRSKPANHALVAEKRSVFRHGIFRRRDFASELLESWSMLRQVAHANMEARKGGALQKG